MSYLRKIFTLFSIFFFTQAVVGQVTLVSTDFENGGLQPTGWTISNTSGLTTQHWGISDRVLDPGGKLFQLYGGAYCDSAVATDNDTLYLVSPTFSTVGFTFVEIDFDLIADISGFDTLRVQARVGAGPWVTFSNQAFYEGDPPLLGGPIWNNKQGYNETSYPALWGGLNPNPALDSSWWRREKFDISSLVSGQPVVQIRFALEDGGALVSPNVTASYLDSVLIFADVCEKIPPKGELLPPIIPNNSIQFSLGPYQVNAKFTDKNSGMDTAFIVYQVNNGAFDTVYMIPTLPSPNDTIWQGQIPKQWGPNPADTMMIGDSVCYYVVGVDASNPCANTFTLPDTMATPGVTCNKFNISAGEPLPFCDAFDVNNFWTDSATPVPAIWERGTPGTFPANSPPNSWATLLTANYGNGIESYLYSPILDFGTAETPRVTFWQNRTMPQDGDEFSLQYSINGAAWTTLGIDNDPNGVDPSTPSCPSTWYGATGSSAVPNTWNGNSSGWVKSFYQMPATFNSVGSVQFRFKFKSDASGTAYGVAIDDFCVENPPDTDIAITAIQSPGDWQANQDHYLRAIGDQDSVMVVFRNLGKDSLTSVTLNYAVTSMTGTTVVTETFNYPRTWNGKVKPSVRALISDTVVFTTRITTPAGFYETSVYPTQSNDADAENDTIVGNGQFGFDIKSISHETDFDDPIAEWSTLPLDKGSCGNPPNLSGTRWERTTPNYGAINSAFSPPNTWVINPDTTYNTNSIEYVFTDYYDFSNHNQAFVSFRQNRNTPNGTDGFRLEYRTAPGQPWRTVESLAGTADEVNWMSGQQITNGNGWSGNSLGWIYSEFQFDSISNPKIPTGPTASRIQFRFSFYSDGNTSTIEDGVAIDDFRIVLPDSIDMEVVEMVQPNLRGCVLDIEEDVEVRVKNVGRTTIDSAVIWTAYRQITPIVSAWDTIKDTVQFAGGLLITEQFDYLYPADFADMIAFGDYEFCSWVDVNLDTNQRNDTLDPKYIASNVDGCDIQLTLTTGTNIPAGSELLMIDTTNLPHDTIYQESFNGIGPSAIQVTRFICMDKQGDYKFVITPTAANFIAFWELEDPIADTSVGSGIAATGPAGFGFTWECPPLLSTASQQISVTGTLTNLPIPQEYTLSSIIRNTGLFNVRSVEVCMNIEKIFPTVPPPPSPILNDCDTAIYFGKGLFRNAFVPNTMNTKWDAEPGLYEICIWTQQPNDTTDDLTIDDTTCIQYTVVDSIHTLNTTPYCNDFDGQLNPWGSFSKTVYSVNSSFEKGTPAQAVLNSANSAPNAWMTGLSTDYLVLDSSGMYSPVFEIVDTSGCYTLSFSHQWETEYSFDGGTIEFTTDSGLTWNGVGRISDTLYAPAQNFYNTPFVVGLGGAPHPPGWTGSSGGIVNSSYELKFKDFNDDTLNVVFRFRFGGDGSIVDEGWMIDNFCIEKIGTCHYASCTDNIQNQGETGIDCGGPCPPCESCFDGVQNQNETGIDCGGVCAPCPSCVDGIQNGLETNIDCGGPDCDPCGTCDDGIWNFQWVEDPPGSGTFVKLWEESFIDCGGPCPPCWVGLDELDESVFSLGQNVPNPTEGRTVIRYAVPNTGPVEVSIQNIMGQTMYQTKVQGSRGINVLEVDVNDWADGVYYYSFQYDGQTLVKKMTVNK